eukprot:TRINITY_DN248_c7_g1_i1.p1 TRINITY_DN248_c7_g1~~TRINITY_DN248_c7_g1_i1.p1  ORF type:complete len:854 (+),score=366.04 TRINITY_DN248_c7_g1_i1:37-2562(+)
MGTDPDTPMAAGIALPSSGADSVSPHRLNAQLAGHFFYVAEEAELEITFLPSGGGSDWDGMADDAGLSEKATALQSLLAECGGELQGTLEILGETQTVSVKKGHVEDLHNEELDQEVDVEGKTDEEIVEERASLAARKAQLQKQIKEDELKDVELTRSQWKATISFPTQKEMVAFLQLTEDPKTCAKFALPGTVQPNPLREGFVLCRVTGTAFHSSLLDAYVKSSPFLKRACVSDGHRNMSQLQTLAAALRVRLAIAASIEEADPQGVVYDEWKVPRFFRIAQGPAYSGDATPIKTFRAVLFPLASSQIYRFTDVKKADGALFDKFTSTELESRLRDMLQVSEDEVVLECFATYLTHSNVQPVSSHKSGTKYAAVFRMHVLTESAMAKVKSQQTSISQYLSTAPISLFEDEVWYDPMLGRVVDRLPEGSASCPTRGAVDAAEMLAQIKHVASYTKTVFNGSLFGSTSVNLDIESQRNSAHARTLEGGVIYPVDNPLEKLAPAQALTEMLVKKHISDFEAHAKKMQADLEKRQCVEKFELGTLLAALFRVLKAQSAQLHLRETSSRLGTTVLVDVNGRISGRAEGPKNDVTFTTRVAVYNALQELGSEATPTAADAVEGKARMVDMLREARSGTFGRTVAPAVSPSAAQAAARAQEAQREAERAAREEEPREKERKVPQPRPRTTETTSDTPSTPVPMRRSVANSNYDTQKEQGYSQRLTALKTLSRTNIEALKEEALRLVERGFLHEVVAALEKRVKDVSIVGHVTLGTWYLMDSLLKATTGKDSKFNKMLADKAAELAPSHIPCVREAKLRPQCSKLVETWVNIIPEATLQDLRRVIASS